MFRQFQELKETRLTERSVYLLIHKKGPISKQDIVKELDGSLTNVHRFISILESEGMIQVSSGSGRRPGMYSICPKSGYAIAGYVNEDVLGLGICDIAGNVIASREALFTGPKTPEKAVDFFEEAMISLKPHLDEARCLGAVIAVKGPLNHDRTVIVNPSYFPDWRNVPLRDMLSERLGMSVHLDLFAETILFGELLFGPHDLKDHIFLLWLDKGMGASEFNRGIMNLDQPERSAIMGHQVVNFMGPPCTCGKKGCLKIYGEINSHFANMRRFIRMDEAFWTKCMEEFKYEPWKLSPELQLIRHSSTMHPYPLQVEDVMSEFDMAYTAALSNVMNVLRLDKIILCGRLANFYYDRFQGIIEKALNTSESFTHNSVDIHWMDLDGKKVMRGGAAYIFNKYINFAV